jgi:hypothetical protein
MFVCVKFGAARPTPHKHLNGFEIRSASKLVLPCHAIIDFCSATWAHWNRTRRPQVAASRPSPERFNCFGLRDITRIGVREFACFANFWDFWFEATCLGGGVQTAHKYLTLNYYPTWLIAWTPCAKFPPIRQRCFTRAGLFYHAWLPAVDVILQILTSPDTQIWWSRCQMSSPRQAIITYL